MQTIRRQIIEFLEQHEANGLEISRALGIPEKEVYEHLPHISRTLQARGRKLVIRPERCLACGYEFADRRRLDRPGRCPMCRKSHIQSALYRIA